MTVAAAFFMRQAIFVPLAMIAPILVGLFVADYNSVAQHMSELELRTDWIAWVVRFGAGVSGLSIMLFAVGCFLLPQENTSGVDQGGGVRFSFTGLVAMLFGVGMVSNGVFIIGSPLHGLYGLPIFSVLVPAFFVAEYARTAAADIWPTWFTGFSLLVALLALIYMWALLVGFDPAAYRGLTQRTSTLVSFGWYAAVAFAMRPSFAAKSDQAETR